MSFKIDLLVSDFKNICRICLKKANLQSIYSFKSKSKSFNVQDLSEKVKLCCGIDIHVEDNLPSNICTACSNLVHNAYKLRSLSENSDKFLRRILYSHEKNIIENFANVPMHRKSKTDLKKSKTEKEVMPTDNHNDSKQEVSNDCSTIEWDIMDDSNNSNEYLEENQKAISQPVEDEEYIWENNEEHSIHNLLRDVSCGARLNDNKNICPICDMQLIKCNLRKHFIAYHSTMMKKGYKCYGCEEILDTRAERELHEDLYCSKISPGTVYTCSVCKTSASNREDFDRHLWIRHRGRPPPKTERDEDRAAEGTASAKKEGYVCETCGQVLRSSTTFNQHMMRHEGRQWLECNLCSFRTSDYRSIIVHKLRHEGRKPFHCQECPYKTDRVDYLKVHQMRHSGERPYSCPYCDYKAVNHSNLKKHKTSHTNVREFRCKVCEKFYKSNRALKHHVLRTHENARMFYCKPCHTKYVGEEALNRHLKKKHPNCDTDIIQETTLNAL